MIGLPPSRRGPGQVEHLGRLHVGEGAEHLLEFRQVGELGKPAARLSAGAIRGDLHRLHDFAERGRPGVEMFDAAAAQPLGVEESLHGVLCGVFAYVVGKLFQTSQFPAHFSSLRHIIGS